MLAAKSCSNSINSNSDRFESILNQDNPILCSHVFSFHPLWQLYETKTHLNEFCENYLAFNIGIAIVDLSNYYSSINLFACLFINVFIYCAINYVIYIYYDLFWTCVIYQLQQNISITYYIIYKKWNRVSLWQCIN